MNFFKALWCRTYQATFKMLLPVLPYREPQILKDYNELVFEFKRTGVERCLLVTDAGLRKLGLTNDLEYTLKQHGIQVFVYDGTVPNPTTKNVADGLVMYLMNNCQALIGFGGGSPMDCAKAIGARVANPKKSLVKMKGVLKVGKKLPPLVAIPTTAGTGSETTLAAVITDEETRHKYAINDFPLIPKYAILDANLTIGLPGKVTSTTGMDALTHAVEAYIGRSTTRRTRECSKQAVKLIFENLETVYKDGGNLEARQNMLHAAYLAGLAFTKSYVGYVHAIAHSLGGKYNTPHGLANAVILPYMLKRYGKTIYKKLYQLGVYVGLFDNNISYQEGAELFIKKIEELNKNMDIPTHLKIEEADIDELAATAEKEGNPLYPVPKLLTKEQLKEIYLQIKE